MKRVALRQPFFYCDMAHRSLCGFLICFPDCQATTPYRPSRAAISAESQGATPAEVHDLPRSEHPRCGWRQEDPHLGRLSKGKMRSLDGADRNFRELLNISRHREILCSNYSLPIPYPISAAVSNHSVTGPSLTNATFIAAWKMPCSTLTPSAIINSHKRL